MDIRFEGKARLCDERGLLTGLLDRGQHVSRVGGAGNEHLLLGNVTLDRFNTYVKDIVRPKMSRRLTVPVSATRNVDKLG